MTFEPGIQRTLQIVGLTVASQSEKTKPCMLRLLTKGDGQFIAVHAGQADVEHRDSRRKLCRNVQRSRRPHPACLNEKVMASGLTQRAQSRVAEVFAWRHTERLAEHRRERTWAVVTVFQSNLKY